MDESQNIPGLPDKRKRLKRRYSAEEYISASHTTILINMVIEGAAAVILIFGFLYLFRFLIYFRDRMDVVYFRFFLGTVVVFAIGWFVFIFMKLRNHYRLFKESQGK